MARIRSKNTKPELLVRSLLRQQGIGYKINNTGIFGNPDIYLSKYRTAVFVHGCFWHRHTGCRFSYIPKSNIDFWDNKFRQNIERDLEVKHQLICQDIKVLVIWECAIKGKDRHSELSKDIMQFLNNRIEPFREI